MPFTQPLQRNLERVVTAAIEADIPRTVLQHVRMTEEERDRFLSSFQTGGSEALAGFAVLGGVFSEGIDLVGDRLHGVVVVGVGLPQIGPERETLKRYYDEAGKNGFDYAYVYPGMNKVLQAAGRLIRSEQDRGVLVLVDDRYLQNRYRRLLPDEWRTNRAY
jgi:DNA excision repair protein ERCC-2